MKKLIAREITDPYLQEIILQCNFENNSSRK